MQLIPFTHPSAPALFNGQPFSAEQCQEVMNWLRKGTLGNPLFPRDFSTGMFHHQKDQELLYNQYFQFNELSASALVKHLVSQQKIVNYLGLFVQPSVRRYNKVLASHQLEIQTLSQKAEAQKNNTLTLTNQLNSSFPSLQSSVNQASQESQRAHLCIDNLAQQLNNSFSSKIEEHLHGKGVTVE